MKEQKKVSTETNINKKRKIISNKKRKLSDEINYDYYTNFKSTISDTCSDKSSNEYTEDLLEAYYPDVSGD